MELLTHQHKERISGMLGCYDRLIFTGTLKQISYSQGMTSYLYSKSIRIFDYPKFAEPFKEVIRGNAEKLSKENNIEIEFVRKSHIRKENLVAAVLKKRGYHSGLVHIISAMESCPSYKPWHDKQTGKTFLKGSQSKCLHYYFYFIDDFLGLCYFRVPTWCPFRLQVYMNGHNILKHQLESNNIGYTLIDNAFDSIEDLPDGQSGWEKAQQLSDGISIEQIHRKLDKYAGLYCPVSNDFGQKYHWSIMQAEYATDIVFKKQETLQGIYNDLVATAIHVVKPENIATFLGQKLDPRYKGEVGNNYNIRIEGSRIKHSMGKNSIKMYDKFSKILRIETTTNDVCFFKHYREVVHRDASRSKKLTGLKKNIYSLPLLQISLKAANKRYLEFISAIENKNDGRKRLEKISQPKIVNKRKYKGFNLFDHIEQSLLMTILRGEFNISGFRNKDIRKWFPSFCSAKVSRLLRRLRCHGLIKKVAGTHKYYATKLAKETILLGQKIKEFVMIPALNY
jgi:hypothetical protein